MTNPFLQVDNVKTDQRARRASVNAAFQRNNIYRVGTPNWARVPLREALMRRLAIESIRYRMSAAAVNDTEHNQILRRLADSMTRDFRHLLYGGRLRYSTAAKAFDLYIKYLWQLGIIKTPPLHCPIDGIVLAAAGVLGSWTRNDDESVHAEWERIVQAKAGTQGAAVWEYDLWLRIAPRLRNRAKANSSCDRDSFKLCREGIAGCFHEFLEDCK